MYNEAENATALLDEALATLGKFADTFEVLIIDDGSSDGTGDIVRTYAESHPQVRLVAHPTNLGYGLALRSGLDHARGDVVAIVDGDRQFRLSDLGPLFSKLDEADIVAGYRINRADASHRTAIARVYHLVLRMMFGLNMRDADCGFKLIRRSVIDTIAPQLLARSASISPELLIRASRAGFRIVEAGVPHHPRVAGQAGGATPKVVVRTIRELIRLRRVLRGGRSSAGTR